MPVKCFSISPEKQASSVKVLKGAVLEREAYENTICIFKARKREPSTIFWDMNTAFLEATQGIPAYCWSTVSGYNMPKVAQACFP